MRTARSFTVLLAGGVIILALGCSRGADPEEGSRTTPQRNSNATQSNTNAQEPLLGPIATNTARGDLERAGMAITGARQYLRENNWDAAASLLRSASKSIGEALAKKPRMYTDFQDLKAALERTIKTVEGRGKDADNQVAQLETWIRALKLNAA